MWWSISALLVLVVWTLWFVLGLGVWIPLTITAIVMVVGFARTYWQGIRATRAACALEAAIAQQGTAHARDARPERRAEIIALQKHVRSSIETLKASRTGKRRGAAALSSLPWYIIIGPPGAGKTTALEKSGLLSPSASPCGSVRGVGGTRNCDWWFTHDAILIDTAGRYMTALEDRNEWLAFLRMLKKHRSHRPINGLLVATSIAEIIDASKEQIASIAKKLRVRIDEVTTELQMVVPVYLLLTKCDLVAGFVEYFGDLRKSDRARAWGATIKLTEDPATPQMKFEREFDILVERIHSRVLTRCVRERNREALDGIYQFPLEFKALKDNLGALVQHVFESNAYQNTLIFRGFYFTSGTQEGRPLDRVLNRMSTAMGLPPLEMAAQPVVEAKSYFLHDVFMNIVFPDQNLAVRTAMETRRREMMRFAIGATATVLGTILFASSVISFDANNALLRDSYERMDEAIHVDWHARDSTRRSLDRLDRVLERLDDFHRHRAEGVPIGLAAGMYQGEKISESLRATYVDLLEREFARPCHMELERRLDAMTGKQYLRDRSELATYLMMGDVEHLDVALETSRLSRVLTRMLHSNSGLPKNELRDRIAKHFKYYLMLVKKNDGVARPLAANMNLVDNARSALQKMPVQDRYHAIFVDSLVDERYDEDGDDSSINRRYPPIDIAEIFADRPEVLSRGQPKFTLVAGPYTENGRYRVCENLKNGMTLLESEHWVLPIEQDERGERMRRRLRRVAEDYEQRYIEEWRGFLSSLTLRRPSTVQEAIALYDTLLRPDHPYLRVLRLVEDHTQLREQQQRVINEDAAKGMMNEKARRQFSAMSGGLRANFNLDLGMLERRSSRVPLAFASLIGFGIAPDVTTRESTLATETPFQKYQDELAKLRRYMLQLPTQPTPQELARLDELLSDAVKKVDTLLMPLDEGTKVLLRPLLLDPLQIGNARKHRPNSIHLQANPVQHLR